MAEKTAEKTLGLKVIVALQAIGGIAMLLMGIAAIALGGAFAAMLTGAQGSEGAAAGGVMGAVAGIIGFVFIIIGAIYLFLAYSLWQLKGWARLVTTVLAVIGLLGFPIGTIMSLIMLYILWVDGPTKALFA